MGRGGESGPSTPTLALLPPRRPRPLAPFLSLDARDKAGFASSSCVCADDFASLLQQTEGPARLVRLRHGLLLAVLGSLQVSRVVESRVGRRGDPNPKLRKSLVGLGVESHPIVPGGPLWRPTAFISLTLAIVPRPFPVRSRPAARQQRSEKVQKGGGGLRQRVPETLKTRWKRGQGSDGEVSATGGRPRSRRAERWRRSFERGREKRFGARAILSLRLSLQQL